MRVSAIVSATCWLSVLALIWAGLLGVVAWNLAAWLSLLAFVTMGLVSALVAGRYGERL